MSHLYNNTKFCDKTHQEKLNHIDNLMNWNSTGISVGYTEEMFNYCTIYQKDKLIDVQIKRQIPLKEFEIQYLRDKKIDIIND